MLVHQPAAIVFVFKKEKRVGSSTQARQQRLANGGAPIFIDTSAPIDTGEAVIGRVKAFIKGWLTTSNGQWKFEGYTTGDPEKFDFNDDPTRGYVKNQIARAVGAAGHEIGAKDYPATYTGSITIAAGGVIP